MAGVSAIVGAMSKQQKLRGAISLISNTPGASTGYGVQAEYLVHGMKRAGLDVAVQSNYGLEGRFDVLKTPYGPVPHYPKGFKPYSDDVIELWHKDFMKDKGDLKSAVMTLYDVWVYKNLQYEGPIISYVPIDHVTMPPLVQQFLQRDNVFPVTMAPFGQKMLEDRNIKSFYAPHSVDTKVFTPTHEIGGVPTRKFMGISEDDFLVTIMAANKSNGILHRKAIAEQLMAFSLFHRERPDSKLYLHMEGSAAFGGFNIPRLLTSVGLDAESVIIADSQTLRVGYPQEELAALYTTSDVLLNATLGEGFGVGTIEAQACGTRVITSDWTASQDLAGPDSWLCDGQPLWDEPQGAWYYVPLIGSLVESLKLAYDAPRGVSLESIKFAKQFDVEKVWKAHWMPFFKDFFDVA